MPALYMAAQISDCDSCYGIVPGRNRIAGQTVLQVLPALEAGGAELGTLDVAAALCGAGARVLVASSGGRDGCGPRC